MPSRSVPSPCSGCGRRTGSKRRTSARPWHPGTPRARARRLAQRRDDLLGSSAKRLPPRTSTTAAIFGKRVAGARGEVDQRAEHLRRQVVDDVPAEIFERVADRRAAGAGHAGDDEHLAGLVSLLVRHRHLPVVESSLPIADLAGRTRRCSWMAAASCGPMPRTSAISLGGRALERGDRAEVPQQLLDAGGAEARDLGEDGLDVAPAALCAGG